MGDLLEAKNAALRSGEVMMIRESSRKLTAKVNATQDRGATGEILGLSMLNRNTG